MKIWVSKDHVRAVRGGVGEFKTAGNYAASLIASEEAKKDGYAQVLWLDAIERNPHMAEALIEGSGIRRCEIDYIAKNELVVKLEDYLRRRSKLEQLVSYDTLKHSKGLYEACEKLFGNEARAKYDEYFYAKVSDHNVKDGKFKK